MNTIGYKNIDSSNYNTTINSKKANNKNDEGNNVNESRELIYDLGSDIFVKSTDEDTTNSLYKPIKNKLTSEEAKALKQEQENLEADFIKKFVYDTINTQNNLLGNSNESGINTITPKTKDLLTKVFGSLENAYPKAATTPEEAKKAISDGGPYSVDAVADRLITMATAIAGDDQEKLQEMREAAQKGFEHAASVFKSATNNDLPQICKDTYTEVMKRFDKLQNKTSDTDQENTSEQNV